MEHIKRILVVDDEEALRITLSQVLEEDGFEVSVASNGLEAMALFQKDPFALVITDIVMPEMNGIELLGAIKGFSNETQVIVMTSYASLETAVAALRAGAYDYLFKPFEDIELISMAARRAMEKIDMLQENRKLIDMLEKRNQELIETNKLLKELAIHDGLTGLYNHRFFQERLTAEVNRAMRYSQKFSVIFIDLDHFKTYNDTNGHLLGDELLRILSTILTANLRTTDLIARYGGDEFAIILPECSNKDVSAISAKLARKVAEYAFAGANSMPSGRVTISCGFATFPENGSYGSSLLQHADDMLYEGKKNRPCQPIDPPNPPLNRMAEQKRNS